MRALAASALLALAALPAAAQSRKPKATITVVNQSARAIEHLYLTEHEGEDWGPDQLGEVQLDPRGGRFTIRDAPCADYDVQLVDDQGESCVVEDVDVCGTEVWTITDRALAACQGG